MGEVVTVTPGSKGGATEAGVGAGGPEGGAPMARPRRVKARSRTPTDWTWGRRALWQWGSTAAAASLGGRLRAPRRGAGPSVVGDDDESSEASEVTMRSEEDEAAADGGAEAVVSAAVGATSRATPPSSASKVPMSGGASGAGRKVLGRRMPARALAARVRLRGAFAAGRFMRWR